VRAFVGRNALTLVSLAAVFSLSCRGGRPDYPLRDVVFDYADSTLELVGGREVEQVFIPNHDGACGVALMMERPDVGECEVILALHAKDRTPNIAERRLACAEVPAKGWVRFDFPPLRATSGQRLVVQVRSPSGRPGAAVRLRMARIARLYPDGKLRVGGEVVTGVLQFVSYHC
jgi:hypothetical protein